MTFKRKLMYTNKSPRRIDRKAGARNKKVIKPLYSSPCYLGEIEKQKRKNEKTFRDIGSGFKLTHIKAYICKA